MPESAQPRCRACRGRSFRPCWYPSPLLRTRPSLCDCAPAVPTAAANGRFRSETLVARIESKRAQRVRTREMTKDLTFAEGRLSIAVPVSSPVDVAIGLGPALLDAQDRNQRRAEWRVVWGVTGLGAGGSFVFGWTIGPPPGRARRWPGGPEGIP